MKEVTIALNDGLAEQLANRASEFGLQLDQFLEKAITRYADRLAIYAPYAAPAAPAASGAALLARERCGGAMGQVGST